MHDEKEEQLEYFPGEVKRVPGKKKGTFRLIDKNTGNQTYPSWVKRAERIIVDPEDLGLRRSDATKDQIYAARVVGERLHQMGFESGVPVASAIVTGIVAEELQLNTKSSGRNKAIKVLHAWLAAGLVQLEASIHVQSGRAMRQKWIFY